MIDFADPSAQVNALFSGAIDAMTDIPFAQLATAQSHSNVKILESPGGGWLPLCMAVDMPPFDNVNVRKAMRLIVDRPAMLAQVLSGHGRVANDLYAPFDADFDKALPQRHQDIDQAKALLKAAGMENLTVDLHTTDGAAGMVDSANIFAAQAKAAGVTINVKNDPNYYGDQYLKLAVLGRLLGHAQLPPAGGARQHPGRGLQRDPLGPHGHAVSEPLQAGRRGAERRQAARARDRDAEARVQPGRLHHPVLQQPARRLQLQGRRASSPARER